MEEERKPYKTSLSPLSNSATCSLKPTKMRRGSKHKEGDGKRNFVNFNRATTRRIDVDQETEINESQKKLKYFYSNYNEKIDYK